VHKAWLFSSDDKPLFMAGFFRTSLAGTGVEFWFMCFKDIGPYSKAMLRFLRRALKRIARFYPAMKISVERSFETGCSFARALGFKEIPPNTTITNDLYAFYRFERG
jgi:hypothetical protein